MCFKLQDANQLLLLNNKGQDQTTKGIWSDLKSSKFHILTETAF